jgi:DNA-binding IclR family transcriptional regulator
MSVCSGIRADGGRCRAQAMRNSEYCINHHPDKAETRRRRASRGGKKGGRGRPIAELGTLRDENAEIRRRLLEEELLPNVAAVAVQSINTDIRAVGAILKAREQEELRERLEALEEALGRKNEGGRRWGA